MAPITAAALVRGALGNRPEEGSWPHPRRRRMQRHADVEQRGLAAKVVQFAGQGLPVPTHEGQDECHAEPRSLPEYVMDCLAAWIGATAILTWLSYGDAARRIIASSYPQLGWLAPPPAPIAHSAPDMTSLAAEAALLPFSSGSTQCR
jgi:hypothetical protein